MKLTEYSGSETVTNMTSVDMGISDDPTDQLLILNVLSNTLYTDKVTAVWREYGCNAFDANVEAGRGDSPIEITLPSKLAPEAKIRDFGYGMTDEQILQVFCKLGRSTKRGSNELVGMLGIGSKAGFAYGDNFTVTSWAKGTKTIYTCFRDKGVPRLSKMHEEPTNSPEGIEVKVPVKLQDIQDFIAKAERVFRFFKVRPIVHGGTLAYKDRGKAAFSGTGWRFIGEASESFAVMGNIGYKIDVASLPLSFGTKRRTMLELGVELDFNIGELEISANREGLQMKDQTLKAISAKLDTAISEIAKVFTDKVKNAKCMWEAKYLYSSAFEVTGASYYRQTLKDVIGSQIMWGGKPITHSRMSVENIEKDPEVQITAYARRWGRSKCKLVPDPGEVNVRDATVLVLNDMPSNKLSPGRVRYWFDQHAGVDTLVVFTFHSKSAPARFFGRRELTGAPMMNMSTMPKPPVVPSAATGATVSAHRSKHSASAFTLKAPASAGQYYSAESQYWDVALADLDTTGQIWVKIEKFLALCGPHSVTPSRLQTQVGQLRKAGILTTPLYGFKTGKWDKVGKAKGWTLLEDHLRDYYDKALAVDPAKQELADYLEAASGMPLVDIAHKDKFPVGSLMREYLDVLYAMLHPAKYAGLWGLVQSGFGSPWLVKPKGLPNPTTTNKAWETKVMKQYPMLADWDKYKLRAPDGKMLKPVIDYVTLIEDNV